MNHFVGFLANIQYIRCIHIHSHQPFFSGWYLDSFKYQQQAIQQYLAEGVKVGFSGDNHQKEHGPLYQGTSYVQFVHNNQSINCIVDEIF